MTPTRVLRNNCGLGKIARERRAGHWDVWPTALVNPNSADYVTSCGGLGVRVTDPAALESALRDALAHNGPATVEVMTNANLI